MLLLFPRLYYLYQLNVFVPQKIPYLNRKKRNQINCDDEKTIQKVYTTKKKIIEGKIRERT